ncbi:hypothetical protein V1478_014288 [Vespula squamosa]|uniref:Uncharacterized protein n=1 Tax=Vespula squamosa TaxID=30214 RepID=A0ABD2A7K8_VESSQ
MEAFLHGGIAHVATLEKLKKQKERRGRLSQFPPFGGYREEEEEKEKKEEKEEGEEEEEFCRVLSIVRNEGKAKYRTLIPSPTVTTKPPKLSPMP